MQATRWIIDTSTKGLCALKRHRKIRLSRNGAPIKVNLGSALGVAPGWINIDGSLNALVASWPKPIHYLLYRFTGSKQYYSFADYHAILRGHQFIHHNLEFGIPLANETADYVFTSHFVEHIPKTAAQHLLAEAFRILRKGGLLRVNVPDLAYATALYGRGEKERMLDNYFFVDIGESYYARHKYMYDFDMLKKILLAIGFQDIQRQAYRQGEMPDLQLLDNRPEETLYVEARKP